MTHNGSPPPPPEDLGQLTPEQERQLQAWRRWTDSPQTQPSSRLRGLAWLLGVWTGCLLIAVAAFWLLSNPRYARLGTASSEKNPARLSGWTAVVVVVGCTGGTMLLGRWLEIQRRR